MDLQGRVCIITGANSGIGRETALALAALKARVVMTVRDSKKGARARKEIVDRTGNDSVEVMICDLSSLDSIIG
ncbi:MAG: SDR family NAD(P)-dependent oxidoreductase [Methanomassiliicoccus sp.]|nr:SDR family NAD(P)-dependent oxidoreductase [Methanomassiliicoccus sp.]